MDIVTHCKVPRYLHNDLPLGNPLGAPYDQERQRRSVEHALTLAVEANEPIVVVTDATWPGDPDWRSVYNRITEENREELLRLGDENRARRAADNAAGLHRKPLAKGQS